MNYWNTEEYKMKAKAIELAIEAAEREYMGLRAKRQPVPESVYRDAMAFMKHEDRIQWEMDFENSYLQAEYGDL